VLKDDWRRAVWLTQVHEFPSGTSWSR